MQRSFCTEFFRIRTVRVRLGFAARDRPSCDQGGLVDCAVLKARGAARPIMESVSGRGSLTEDWMRKSLQVAGPALKIGCEVTACTGGPDSRCEFSLFPRRLFVQQAHVFGSGYGVGH